MGEVSFIGLDLAKNVFQCCDPRDFLHLMLESGPTKGPDSEAIKIHGRADHRHIARA